jgi:hypothetical protein
MFDVRRSGSMADMVREVRDVSRTWVPYASSAALTKSAQAAQRAIVEEMPRRFDRPVAYTLNAMRVVPSTVQTQSAAVAVKDQAGARGTRPESYLFPEVEGGPRREKRTERALRLAGLLRPGEWVVPGRAAPLDANGNLTGAYARRLIQTVIAQQRGEKGRAPRGKLAFFVGPVGKKGTRGVWERDGRDILPILIFTRKAPTYTSRLPFTEVADKAVRATFPTAFGAELAAIRARKH